MYQSAFSSGYLCCLQFKLQIVCELNCWECELFYACLWRDKLDEWCRQLVEHQLMKFSGTATGNKVTNNFNKCKYKYKDRFFLILRQFNWAIKKISSAHSRTRTRTWPPVTGMRKITLGFYCIIFNKTVLFFFSWSILIYIEKWLCLIFPFVCGHAFSTSSMKHFSCSSAYDSSWFGIWDTTNLSSVWNTCKLTWTRWKYIELFSYIFFHSHTQCVPFSNSHMLLPMMMFTVICTGDVCSSRIIHVYINIY